MHVDQIAISSRQVAALIADQVPSLAGQEVVPLNGGGTVNSVFRIGDTVTARFPLRSGDPDRLLLRLRKESEASAAFVRACPVPAPRPLHVGHPGHGYPLPWTAQSWVPGTHATPSGHQDSTTLAVELSGAIERLRASGTGRGRFEGPGRGGRLVDHDDWVTESIARSDGLLDVDAMRSMWSQFRALPREDPDLMCHGDMTPSNVLVTEGHSGAERTSEATIERAGCFDDRAGETKRSDEKRVPHPRWSLAGLLDTGGFQPADPALDLVAAWHLFAEPARDAMRRSLGCSDLQWARGAAWAFEQAIGAYWYYRDTNPTMAGMGRTTLDRLASAFT